MKTLGAHNAVTAVVAMYGEIIAEQATELANLRRRNDELMSAVAALGNQLKEQALGRFNLEGVATSARDPRGRPVSATDDRPGVGDAEPADDRDEVQSVRGRMDHVVRVGSGTSAHRELCDGPPAPGRAGPEDGSGDEGEDSGDSEPPEVSGR